MMPNHTHIRFIHDAEVGVKWTSGNFRHLFAHFLHSLDGEVVHHQMQFLTQTQAQCV